MYEPTQRCQIKDIRLHQCLSHAADICDQPIQEIETHGLTDDNTQDFYLFLVGG